MKMGTGRTPPASRQRTSCAMYGWLVMTCLRYRRTCRSADARALYHGSHLAGRLCRRSVATLPVRCAGCEAAAAHAGRAGEPDGASDGGTHRDGGRGRIGPQRPRAAVPVHVGRRRRKVALMVWVQAAWHGRRVTLPVSARDNRSGQEERASPVGGTTYLSAWRGAGEGVSLDAGSGSLVDRRACS
jgi:hypothetical protein